MVFLWSVITRGHLLFGKKWPRPLNVAPRILRLRWEKQPSSRSQVSPDIGPDIVFRADVTVITIGNNYSIL